MLQTNETGISSSCLGLWLIRAFTFLPFLWNASNVATVSYRVWQGCPWSRILAPFSRQSRILNFCNLYPKYRFLSQYQIPCQGFGESCFPSISQILSQILHCILAKSRNLRIPSKPYPKLQSATKLVETLFKNEKIKLSLLHPLHAMLCRCSSYLKTTTNTQTWNGWGEETDVDCFVLQSCMYPFKGQGFNNFAVSCRHGKKIETVIFIPLLKFQWM